MLCERDLARLAKTSKIGRVPPTPTDLLAAMRQGRADA
jgi:hypothetical protein